MEKLFIKNRKNQKMAVVVEASPNQKSLVFVMHGLGGFKEQDHIQMFADAFREEGFTVVRFDATRCSIGESGGKYEDTTTTSYFEDLEDVVEWAKDQSWYEEPFFLVGHSLGSLVALLYAEKYSHKIKGLVPTSANLGGNLALQSPDFKKIIPDWQRTGWHIRTSRFKPGIVLKLKWRFVEDLVKNDGLKEINKIRTPVLLIVGENDDATPPEHQRILFDKLPGEKELHIIKGAPHTFRDKEHLNKIKNILKNWIKKIMKEK